MEISSSLRAYLSLKSLERSHYIKDVLLRFGVDYVINEKEQRPDADTLRKLARQYDIMIGGFKEAYDKTILTPDIRVKCIATLSTGTNHIDLDRCKELGITVIATPGANANSVAEHALALILSLAKTLPSAMLSAKSGLFRSALKRQAIDVSKRSVGIIGFGKVARRLVELLKPFRCDISIYTFNPSKYETKHPNLKFVDELVQLFSTCEFLVVAIPLSQETKGLISSNCFKAITGNLYFINVARAEIVDTIALVEALKNCTLSGAALDVYDDKELDILADGGFLLTPHIAGITEDASLKMEQMISSGLEDYLKTQNINVG